MSCHLVTNAGSVDPACVAFVPGQFGRTQGVWRKRRRPHCCQTNVEPPYYLIETFISLTCIHTGESLSAAFTGARDNSAVFQHSVLCSSRGHCTWEAGKTVKWTEAWPPSMGLWVGRLGGLTALRSRLSALDHRGSA